MRLKVYIASSYADRDRSIELMKYLEGYGLEITSTWLREPENDGTDAGKRWYANLDLDDVERADVLVALTYAPTQEPRGTLVEIGYALAKGKPVLWLGRQHGECIFHHASGVYRTFFEDPASHDGNNPYEYVFDVLGEMFETGKRDAPRVEQPLEWVGREELVARCARAERQRDAYLENLTATQKRCTELIDDLRALKRLPAPTAAAFGEIAKERERQNAKWKRLPGYWRAPDEKIYLVLAEEVGEIAKALLERAPEEDLRAEIIQVAAVAACWAEDFETDARSRDPDALPEHPRGEGPGNVG